MARFKLKSKLTSGGLMGHSANQPKLNNSSKTPFFQQYQQPEDIKGLRVTKTDPVTGKAMEAYVPGAKGTVSEERGTYDETFANITPEQMTKVTDEGFSGDFEGYKKYVDAYNEGTLPSQRVDYKGNLKVTDATSGTKGRGYTYEGTPRNIDSRWSKHYGFKDFTSENPTWREQQDKLKASELYRSFSREKQGKVMEAYKKSFLKMNPNTTLTKGPSSTVRTYNSGTSGDDGSTEYLGLIQQ